MTAALMSSSALALAVLAAHFSRSSDFALAAVALAMIALLFVRRPWAARTVQLALALGTLEWLRTLAALVATRQSTGAPYARLALILGTVAVATALCALAFESRAMRARYGR